MPWAFLLCCSKPDFFSPGDSLWLFPTSLWRLHPPYLPLQVTSRQTTQPGRQYRNCPYIAATFDHLPSNVKPCDRLMNKLNSDSFKSNIAIVLLGQSWPPLHVSQYRVCRWWRLRHYRYGCKIIHWYPVEAWGNPIVPLRF